MKSSIPFVVLLAALWLWLMPAAAASTIDVTNSSDVTLSARDDLRFGFQVWNYGAWAPTPLPSRISFRFAFSPTDMLAGHIVAALTSADGSYILPLDSPATLSTGVLTSAAYKGPVSVLSGAVTLDEAEGEALFGANGRGSAYLVLRDLGRGVTLALPGFTLSREMTIALGGRGISVGAVTGPVYLDSRPRMEIEASFSDTTPVPEPGPPAGVAAGLLALAGWALWRRNASA